MNTRRIVVVAMVAAAAAAAALPAQAQEKGRLALFGAEVGPEFAFEKAAIDEGVYNAVRGTGRFEILRDTDLFKILQFDPQIALRNCGIEPMCISQLGDTVKVFWIARTSVVLHDGKARIEASVFDVAGAKFLGAANTSVPWPGGDLKDEAARLAVRVLKKVGTGNISIDEPPGGEILVDGAASGTIPALVEGVAAGVHRVRVTFKGHDYWADDVKVSVGETVVVTPKPTAATAAAAGVPAVVAATAEISTPVEPSKLVPSKAEGPSKPLPPPLNDPYFYTLSGATVAFLSVGLAMAVLKSSDEDAARGERLQVKANEYLTSAETKATTANIFFGLGLAALAGTGVVVYLDLAKPAPPAPVSMKVEPVAAPGYAGASVSGSF